MIIKLPRIKKKILQKTASQLGVLINVVSQSTFEKRNPKAREKTIRAKAYKMAGMCEQRWSHVKMLESGVENSKSSL